MLLIGKPSISMGHLYHGELLNNQRVAQLTWAEPPGSRSSRSSDPVSPASASVVGSNTWIDGLETLHCVGQGIPADETPFFHMGIRGDTVFHM